MAKCHYCDSDDVREVQLEPQGGILAAASATDALVCADCGRVSIEGETPGSGGGMF